MRDGFGDEFLSGVVHGRIVGLVVMAYERVRELVAEHAHLGVDVLVAVDRQTFAGGLAGPAVTLGSGW